MRNTFAKKITQLAQKKKKIVLLSGDIGNRLFDDFKNKFPERFYNCGVAETNMVGVAAGLASAGFIPFCYTITPFLISKCFEQIRLDVCYQKLNVYIVGTGSGLSYSRLGPTHHSLEDIGLMQLIPNMKICTPSDPVELSKLMPQLLADKGPYYLRLGKKGEPNINHIRKKIKLGDPNIIQKGKDVLIISLGNILKEANILKNKLIKNKKNPTLLTINRIKPLNLKKLKVIIKNYKNVIIIEEHFLQGGLSNMIKSNYEYLNLNKKNIKIFHIEDKFYNGLGEQADAREKVGISGDQIYKKIKNSL
ncbi:transketolase [Candidatus Pelagibacter sp.]|nr:transketolase [Candidatus Pelagibacter sp.]